MTSATTPATTTDRRWTLLARLVRPQGRKGEIIADLFTDFPDRFATHPRVYLMAASPASIPPREALIERHWLHQGRVVFKFQGIDSINDAETLRGLEVVVPVEERMPLAEDEVYIGDLIGCVLIDLGDPSGEVHIENEIGFIEDVERGTNGALDLLVVRPASIQPPSVPQPAGLAETRPRRGQRAKKLPELLIPFAKKYLVTIDIAAQRVVMRLPSGLTALNAEIPSNSP